MNIFFPIKTKKSKIVSIKSTVLTRMFKNVFPLKTVILLKLHYENYPNWTAFRFVRIHLGTKLRIEEFFRKDFGTRFQFKSYIIRLFSALSNSNIFWKISIEFLNFSKNNWIRQGRKQVYKVALRKWFNSYWKKWVKLKFLEVKSFDSVRRINKNKTIYCYFS